MADATTDTVKSIKLEDVGAVLDRAATEKWTSLTLIGENRGFLARPGPNVYVIEDGVLSDTQVERLGALTALTTLDLDNNDIGDAGAQSLSGLPALTTLNLANNGIGAAGAQSLSGLTALTSLSLNNNGFGDAGAQALSGLTALTTLDLDSNGIGAAGARSLSDLTALTTLYLARNGIGDAGAQSLSGLTALTSLDLDDNDIGAAGARAILDAWADAETASRKSYLSLSDNQNIGSTLPAEIFGTTDAQEFLAAYRRFRDEEGVDDEADLPEGISVDQPRALSFSGDEGRIGGSIGGVDGEVVADTAITRDFRDRAKVMAERMLAIAAGEAGRGNAFHDLREKAEDLLQALGDAPESIRPALLSALVGEMENALIADDARQADPDMEDRPPLSTELREALANTLESAGRLVTHDDLLASLTKDLSEDEISIAQSQAITVLGDGAVEAGAADEAARHDLAIVVNAAPRSGVTLRSAGNFVRSGIRIAWEAMEERTDVSNRVRAARFNTARWIVTNRDAIEEFVKSPRVTGTKWALDRIERWVKQQTPPDDPSA